MISAHFLRSAAGRLAADQPLRRALPGWGRVHIDRQLPFVCVYRRPQTSPDGLTGRLITTQASYVVGAANEIAPLVRTIAATLSPVFGGFLVLEVWETPSRELPGEPGAVAPGFRILAPRGEDLSSTVQALAAELTGVRIYNHPAEVAARFRRRIAPPRRDPLLSAAELVETGANLIGLGVRPVHRDPRTREVYPLVLRALRRQLHRPLAKTVFAFSRAHTTQNVRHYHALGRRALVKAVWEVDRGLAEVGGGFDFLLQVTPMNLEAAWIAFRRSRFERAPRFLYRPLPVLPGELKRKLYQLPLGRVEDPVIAFLFFEKQRELDRQLSMLQDLETGNFLYGSLQVFGRPDQATLRFAQQLLDRIPPRTREFSAERFLTAPTIAEKAKAEIARLRESLPDLEAQVEIRDDVQGLMVSRGNVLVGSGVTVPPGRAYALLQHEVGTHVLTYYNGRAQRFAQLHTGLAGYDETQEGFAVVAEYLCGGLTRKRLRLLAARVAAVETLVAGATFVETYRKLNSDLGFGGKAAFGITARVHRGGGLTKDALYLRGLVGVLDYLVGGGDLEPLLVGKISARHIPLMRELLMRRVLRPPPLRPRYLEDPGALARLDRVRASKSPPQLLLQSLEEKAK